MKDLEEVVLEVTRDGWTACPCCGLAGRLVRSGILDRNTPELRVEVVVDVRNARHSMTARGIGRFEVRLVEKIVGGGMDLASTPSRGGCTCEDMPAGKKCIECLKAALGPGGGA